MEEDWKLDWDITDITQLERDKDSWDITDKGRVAVGSVTFGDELMAGMRSDTGFRDKIGILKVLDTYGPVPMDYLPDLLLRSGSISKFRGFSARLSKLEWLENLECSLDYLIETGLIERVPFDIENPWRPPEKYWSNRENRTRPIEKKGGLIDKVLTNWYMTIEKWNFRLGVNRIRANQKLREESKGEDDEDKRLDIFSNL